MQTGMLWLLDLYHFYFPLLFYCSSLTSSTVLNWRGDHAQLCLVPDFNGVALGFSPFSTSAMGLTCRAAFIMLRFVLSIPVVSRTFIMKGCYTLSKEFSVSTKMIIYFVFKSIYKFYYIYQFAYVKLSLHLWDKANLVMVNIIHEYLCSVCCYVSLSALILLIWIFSLF